MASSPRLLAILAGCLSLAPVALAEAAPGSAAAPESAPIKFAVISDTHVTRDTEEDHAQFRGRLDRVIAAVNAAHVSFVLVSGDLTQSGKPEQYADFKAQIARVKPPLLWVPGNHDVGNKKLPPRDAGPKEEQLHAFEAALGPSYYAKDVAGVHIVAVNSQLLGSGLAEEAAEWAFLEEQLGKPAAPRTVVLMHVPPFLDSADEPAGAYWGLEPAPRQHFLELLRRSGVKLVIAGHLHRPLVNHYAGILFAICPSAAWGIPRGKTPIGWTLVTLRGDGEAQVEFKPILAPDSASAEPAK